MADCRNLVKRIDNLSLALCKGVNYRLKRLAVGRHRCVCRIGATVRRLVGNRAADSYTLAKTLCQYLLVLHIDKLILKGRATCVNNKNLHFNFLR